MQGSKSSAAPVSQRGGGVQSSESTLGASSFSNLIGSSGLLYRPIRELGAGGMARILLAYAHGTSGFSKLVVLKVMRPSLGETTFRTMFLEEARLSARLNHPNLVQVYEVVDTGDVPYMVMEYLEGKPLSAFHAKAILDEATRLTVLSEALIGLHYAHELVDFSGKPLNLVHRDVSPHNIFVTYDGAVKVLDFGIAKTDTAQSHTQTGEVKGKLAYMAPEQLFGDKLDRRADIFAMGVILWETAVGAPLWENVAPPQLMHRLATGSIPRPSERAAVDPDLEQIIIRATAAEPDQRYATALEMHQALREYALNKNRFSSVRDVGVALASAFASDREEERRIVSEALRESLGPPPNEGSEIMSVSGSTQPARVSILTWIFAAIAAFLLGLGALYLLDSLKKTEAPPKLAREAAPASAVRLELRVTPPESNIELDGKLMGRGSLHLEVPSDDREHQLVLSAPNHLVTRRTLKFDRSHDLNVVLSPEPSASVNEPPRVAAPNPSERTRPAPSPAQAPRAAPAQKRPSAAAPAPAAQPAAPAAQLCDPPYYFKAGIKTYRPECL